MSPGDLVRYIGGNQIMAVCSVQDHVSFSWHSTITGTSGIGHVPEDVLALPNMFGARNKIRGQVPWIDIIGEPYTLVKVCYFDESGRYHTIDLPAHALEPVKE